MSDRNESPFEIVSKEEVESSQQKDRREKEVDPFRYVVKTSTFYIFKILSNFNSYSVSYIYI